MHEFKRGNTAENKELRKINCKNVDDRQMNKSKLKGERQESKGICIRSGWIHVAKAFKRLLNGGSMEGSFRIFENEEVHVAKQWGCSFHFYFF